MTKYICTYFDFNFLPRGLALIDSIKKNVPDFKVYILALDQETFVFLTNLNSPNIKPISLDTYINYFNIDLNRFENKKQFYFSVTPNLCLYVLQNNNEIDILLYLDADVYLYNNLDSLYHEIGTNSIAICSHRLNPILKFFSGHYGHYNVGVNAFRNDDVGLQCVKDWKQDCDSWYLGQPNYPLSFFSDQIFLDSWPEKYLSLKVIENIGVNVAPWNAINYNFTEVNGVFYINGSPLIIYHFSSLKKIGQAKWHGNTNFYVININGVLLNIYKKYIKIVEKNLVSSSAIAVLDFEGSRLKFLFHWLMKRFFNEEIDI